MNHIWEEFSQVPPITRGYISLCIITTISVQLELVSPFQLYFNPSLIFKKFEIWRLFTNFWFFGMIGFNFFFNMIFAYRYCRMLEENSFRNRAADFLYMFLFGGICMNLIGIFVNMVFLGQAFTLMIVYIWSRRNPYIRMNFFGLLNFQAPYLPWVLLAFSYIMGNSVIVDVMGIVVGHLYYFLEDVFPNQTHGVRLLKTPKLLCKLMDFARADPMYAPLPEELSEETTVTATDSSPSSSNTANPSSSSPTTSSVLTNANNPDDNITSAITNDATSTSATITSSPSASQQQPLSSQLQLQTHHQRSDHSNQSSVLSASSTGSERSSDASGTS